MPAHQVHKQLLLSHLHHLLAEEDLEANAEALLAEAQANPTMSEAVTNAQAAINKLSDESKKTDLQSQLDAVSAEVTNESNAETAVATAESEQTSANVTAAEAAIDVLTNETVKDQLQARLDAVSNAIAATTQSNTTSGDSTYSTYDNTILIRLSLIAILTDTNHYVNRAYLFSHWRNLFSNLIFCQN